MRKGIAGQILQSPRLHQDDLCVYRMTKTFATVLLVFCCLDSAPSNQYGTSPKVELNTAGYLGQPLVLNFFAEWCAPCVREMPAFEEVHQEVGDSVAFLGLSIDRVASDGQALVDATGITYDVGRDATGDALGDLGGTGMPTTVFVDEAGTVVEVHSGELTADDLRARLDEHFG